MILFKNSIIKLDYDPATDILEVDYPDLHGYLLPEIKHAITILVDYVKNYDVKRVLLDSTKTLISVSEEESREIATFLAAGLVQTRVQKLARLQSHTPQVEETAQENIRHIRETLPLSFKVHNFTSKTEALAWLKIHDND